MADSRRLSDPQDDYTILRAAARRGRYTLFRSQIDGFSRPVADLQHWGAMGRLDAALIGLLQCARSPNGLE